VSGEQLGLDFERPAPEPVACERCGEEFVPAGGPRRFCSEQCRKRASEESIRERDAEARLAAGTQVAAPCRCEPHDLVFADGSEPTCALCGRRANVLDVVRALRDRHRRPRR
jgi:hypothetical protein